MGGGAEWICNYEGMLMLSGSSKTVTISICYNVGGAMVTDVI